MRLLVLGGTKFLGRHIVDATLGRGHTVTIFTRGKLTPEMPDGVEWLRGDRDGDLGALAGRRWEAVIDTSGYFPRLVRASAEALRDAVERYVFISTISVYPEFGKVGIDESAPVGIRVLAPFEGDPAVLSTVSDDDESANTARRRSVT